MAAALVEGSFLSAFLQVLFDRMATPEFLNLFRKRKSDDKLLKKLKMNLLVVGAVLDDAENKETTNQAVKQWLEELHDTVVQADDLLDKINTEALRIKIEAEYQSPGNQLVNCNINSSISCLSNEFLNGLMPQIEDILVSLEGFIQHITPLGLQVGASKRQSYRLPSTSLVDVKVTYGRDGDKEKIVEILLSDDDDVNGGTGITMVAIVGLGGIGKTTLAQLVYQDERVKQHFPATRAWVCVSEEYDAFRITKDLLRELNIPVFDFGESLNSLQVKLQNALNQQKFLLVLDDVWNSNSNDWDNLMLPFKGCLRDSKIIVTTRNQEIAQMMCKEECIHLLDPISEEDSWSLFKKYAFENRDDNGQNLELEKIGKKIVKKCSRLPLAVKTVAGLLRSKILPDEWKDILTSDVWSQTEIQHGILPALRLSYVHLPSYLKRCFAFCAVFPKDYNFKKELVIQLWLANDLLGHPRDHRRMGEECFRELTSRSLFQRLANNYFTMHDLVNDLARFVSGKYCLRLEDYRQGHCTIASLNHLSCFRSTHCTFGNFKLLEEAAHLRTILPLSFYSLPDGKFFLDALPSFKSLRVLPLSYYGSFNLSDSFSNLKQLRFLDLSGNEIEKLPAWICTFYNLQTFLLSNCKKLKELPVDMGKLVNLSYLDISGVSLKSMPTKMGRLKNLEVLSAFIVGKDSGSTIEELGKLPKLSGKLFLSGLENVSCGRDSSMAKMKAKERLEDLALIWNGDVDNSNEVRDVLDSLEPHSRIKHLKINGYHGTSFPDWVGSPSFCHMKSLSLYDCQYCFELPALGRLPSLESLEIVGMSKISALTEEFYGDSREIKPFSSLKNLKIMKMLELERWDIPAECEVFYNLKELHIIGCPELERWDIPAKCEVLCNLKELRIFDCPKLVGNLPKELSSLEILNISGCDKLVLANDRIQSSSSSSSLASLTFLYISHCEGLISFPEGGLPVPNLTHFYIYDCEGLMSFPEGGLSAPNLTRFHITKCKKLKSLPKRMESLLPSLIDLDISDCPEIECFPEGGLPSTLQFLSIHSCPLLQSLPDEGLPASLTTLQIRDCPLLKPRLEWVKGQDWPKIAHIPRIVLDDDNATQPHSSLWKFSGLESII